jgi:hypothetical protein
VIERDREIERSSDRERSRDRERSSDREMSSHKNTLDNARVSYEPLTRSDQFRHEADRQYPDSFWSMHHIVHREFYSAVS